MHMEPAAIEPKPNTAESTYWRKGTPRTIAATMRGEETVGLSGNVITHITFIQDLANEPGEFKLLCFLLLLLSDIVGLCMSTILFEKAVGLNNRRHIMEGLLGGGAWKKQKATVV